MTRIFSYILIAILAISCEKKQELIQNPERIADIRAMISVQKELTKNSQVPIWDIFDQPISPEEKQALEFIYAYMPLSDLADYQPGFFLKNVQFSL